MGRESPRPQVLMDCSSIRDDRPAQTMGTVRVQHPATLLTVEPAAGGKAGQVLLSLAGPEPATAGSVNGFTVLLSGATPKLRVHLACRHAISAAFRVCPPGVPRTLSPGVQPGRADSHERRRAGSTPWFHPATVGPAAVLKGA